MGWGCLELDLALFKLFFFCSTFGTVVVCTHESRAETSQQEMSTNRFVTKFAVNLGHRPGVTLRSSTPFVSVL